MYETIDEVYRPMSLRKIAIAVGLLLTAVAGAEPVQDIDNTQLQDLIAAGVPVIDVRTAGEWQQTGIIAGSHLMTFFDEQGKYDAQGWLQALQRIAQPDQPVALICATGGRTKAIGQFLNTQVGYQQVYNVGEGIYAWMKAGHEVVPVE